MSERALQDEIELLKQRLEFAEWEWGRATDGMKERDAEIERLREQLEKIRVAAWDSKLTDFSRIATIQETFCLTDDQRSEK